MTEEQALQPFKEAAHEFHSEYCCGQGSRNQMCANGRANFQFGDLRIDIRDEADVIIRRVIVEVESAGGVTNFAKYWYALQKNEVKEPVTLLHLFMSSFPKDYESHKRLWDFLYERMRKELGNRIDARRFDYPAELDKALDAFKSSLSRIGKNAAGGSASSVGDFQLPN